MWIPGPTVWFPDPTTWIPDFNPQIPDSGTVVDSGFQIAQFKVDNYKNTLSVPS